jgi:hypothetical protein
LRVLLMTQMNAYVTLKENNMEVLKPKKVIKEEGPDHPLYEPKKYKCRACKKETVNRFKCHDCWKDCPLVGGIDEL